jgi:hypothetical protein
MQHSLIADCDVLLLVWWWGWGLDRGWTLAHGVLSMFIAVMIIRTVYPLFQYTGLILLQTTPGSIHSQIEKCCKLVCMRCLQLLWCARLVVLVSEVRALNERVLYSADLLL